MKEVVNKVDKMAKGPLASLTLLQLLDRAYAWFEEGLLRECRGPEPSSLGRADLRLLANLNCGTTYSSELARRLGVSRQAVGKLVKNLEKEGLVVLETDPEQRNLKRIVITPEGERWIRAAVGELQRMEQVLAMRLGEKSMAVLRQVLEADWGESAETSTNLTRRQGQSCGRECPGI